MKSVRPPLTKLFHKKSFTNDGFPNVEGEKMTAIKTEKTEK